MARQQVSKWGFIGMGGLACVLFLCLGTGNIAPWWATLLLILVWGVLCTLGARWFTRAPGRVPWVALAAFAIWLATVLVGTNVLGWRP